MAPQPPAAPAGAKKKGPVIVVAIAVAVPILALGGWLAYQHFFNWGYALAPSEVKEVIDPYVDELEKAAEEGATACRVLADLKKQGTGGLAQKVVDNPLKGLKVLADKRLLAARADCEEGREGGDTAILPPLEGVKDLFEVSVSDNDEFVCMVPNFLGLDDDDKSDCVQWKGSGAERIIRYDVERKNEQGGARVIVELKGSP
jgi:hypothetical protein